MPKNSPEYPAILKPLERIDDDKVTKGYRQLIAAVLIRTLKDADTKDGYLSALVFAESKMCEAYCDGLDISPKRFGDEVRRIASRWNKPKEEKWNITNALDAETSSLIKDGK